jgi:hypothetical protein
MTARWKRVEIKAMLAMVAKNDAGVSVRQIAEEHGCSIAQAQTQIKNGRLYQKGEALLAENPKNLDGLIQTGRLLLGGWCRHVLVRQYGISALDDLTCWSRRELISLSNFGCKKVDAIEVAMSKAGLSLRSDGEWVEHEYCAEYQAEQEESGRRCREQQAQQLANDWATTKDRDTIIGYARAVADIWRRAYTFLKAGRDDPELFKVIARALQKEPPICNPVFDDLKRVEEGEKSEAARAADMEEAAKAREAANRRIAELVREAGTDGNVIAFPVAAMRAIPQIGGEA